MKKQSAKTNVPRITTVLSVSPLAEDHVSLQAVLSPSKWELHKCDSVVSALAVIRRSNISVVICDQVLSPGTWNDMLSELSLLRIVPPLIVTSRLADEKLWV